MRHNHPHHQQNKHDKKPTPTRISDHTKQNIRAFFFVLCLATSAILFRVLPFLPVNFRQSVLFIGLFIILFSFSISAFFGLYLQGPLKFKNTQVVAGRVSKSEGRYENELSLERFKRIVQEALDSIPEEFHKQMDNVVILVESEPDEETLERVGVKEGHILLGLYQGVPLTALGHQRAPLPERITLYQKNIETYCHGDPERIREQVRATLLHEIAHHFGMDHEDMPIWIK
jgi:predicted Zn-dependent protease with MMP-like domain